MKEAELAATKKGKERHVGAQEPANLRDGSETANGNRERSDGSNVSTNADKTSLNNSDDPAKCSSERTTRMDVELNVINKRSNKQNETTGSATRSGEDNVKEQLCEQIGNGNLGETRHPDNRTDRPRDTNDLAFLDADVNLNEFEMISSKSCSESSKDNSLDNRLEGKALIATGNSETPSEKTNLIT